jgi:hypothetical protein
MNGKDYYYLNGETKIGPFQLEALKSMPIRPDTLVWNNSLPDWVQAGSLPELQSFFASTGVPPSGGYQTANTFSYNHPGDAVPPMPENYLVWAILATIFCCWPIGIAAIVNAAKVSSLYGVRNYAEAQKASENAKKWTIWTAVAGGVFWILYILFFLVFGLTALGLSD